ncbi:TPA: hypothetical protein ACOEHG_000585 [Enterobacter ludwigii]
MDDLISFLPAILSLTSAGIGAWCAFISFSTLRRKSRAQEQFEIKLADELQSNVKEKGPQFKLEKSFSDLKPGGLDFNRKEIDELLDIIDKINKGSEIKSVVEVNSNSDTKIVTELLAAYKSLDVSDKNEISNVLKTGTSLSVNRFLTRSLYSALDIIMSRFTKA